MWEDRPFRVRVPIKEQIEQRIRQRPRGQQEQPSLVYQRRHS